MPSDLSPECRELCFKIIAEKDPAKMLHLVKELNRMLEEKKPAARESDKGMGELRLKAAVLKLIQHSARGNQMCDSDHSSQ